MDSRAMQKGVQQQMNAMDIPIESEDTLYYLNRATEKYIDEQYVLLRGKYTDNQNVELYTKAQQAIENLRSIISTEIVDNADINDVAHFDNAKKFLLGDLTNDFYYYVRSQTKTGQNEKWVNNKLMEQENIQKYIKTKYHSPVFRDFLILIEGSEIYVFFDDQDVDVYEVALTFIKEPKKLVLESASGNNETTTSELPIHTHQDVVNIAVELMVRDKQISNPRLKDSE